MARVIGFVKSLQNGVFFAKDEQGAIRELKAGEQIFQNELVYGASNNPQNAEIVIDVAFADAKDIILSGSSQLYTDLSVISGTFEKEDAVVSKDSVENAWKLSTDAPSPDGQVDAPAAGLEETAAGQGLSDTERAGGPIFDARTGAIGNVTTDLRDTINGELNPTIVALDTQNLNDQPVVTDVTGAVNEALNGLNIISGQLVVADPDVADTHTFFVVDGSLLINGQPAPEDITLVLNLDGTYSVTGDFNALAVGENAVVKFEYYSVDNGIDAGAPHASLPATVTLTITGTNDQPVVSDVNTTQDESLNGINTFAGSLVATDDDTSDTHTFNISGIPSVDSSSVSGLNVSLSTNGEYTVAGDFNKLAAGESATVTFQYYAVDSSSTQVNGESNISEVKTITMIVTGTNDQPVIGDIHIIGTGEGGVGLVGYYDMRQGSGTQVQQSILEAGNFDTRDMDTLDINELSGLNVLYIDKYSSTSEYTTNLSDINQAVFNGMTLIINDGSPDEANGILPGLGTTLVRISADSAEINIGPDGGELAIGAAGILDNSSLDYGSSSHHGAFDINSLPEGAKILLTSGNPNEVVAFSYEYGSGTVIYSSMPLSAYFDPGWLYNYAQYQEYINAAKIYIQNTIEDTGSAIYETHDNGEVTPLVNDGNNILSGNLSVVDDDVTDTHTFRVVDESVQILDVLNAGIDFGDVSVSISQNGEGVWQYNINGNFTELAAGEKATVTFQYVADDGHGFDGTDGINESSVSVPKTITLAITGTNDQPVVSDVSVNGAGDGESIVGLDTLSHGQSSGGWDVFGQVFIATEATLGKVEFNLIGDTEGGTSTYTVEIRNALNEIIYSNDGSVANGSNIVTLDLINVDLQVGEKYLVRIIETSGNINAMYSNGDSTDTVGSMFGDDLTGYLNYDIGIRLTYGSGEQVIYEVLNDSNTFMGQLEAIDDDTNDTHTFFGVLNEGNNGDGAPAARAMAPIEPSIAYELDSPAEGVRIESITVYEDGRYTIQGDFNALAAGESATVTFQYYAVDSSSTQVNGESNTSEIKTVTMTITGTNDHPIVSDVTTTQNEALDGINTFAGTLVATDDDESDTHTFTISGTPSVDSSLVSGLNVSLLDNGDYTVTGDFNKLAAGESATVTFQYYAVDSSSTQVNGESNTSELKTVTMIVTGTNDQPVISDININVSLSFGSENWFAEGNGLTIVGYENNGSIVTPILHNGGLGIGSGWGEDSQINDQMSFSGRSAEAILFGFEKAFNTATIELTSLNQGTWFSNDEKAEWIAYKDGVEVGRGILTAQSGADIFTIHTTSDFNSLKIAPPLDWESDSFYIKSLNISKTFYESYDATPIDTTEDVSTTFSGNLDATVMDDDTNDEHQFFGVMGEDEESIAYELESPSTGVSVDTITINPDGTYTVTGNFNALAAGESATISFQYYAVDNSSTQVNGESNTSESKTVTMTITGTNDQPIVTDFTVSVSEASLLEVQGKEDYRYVGQLDASDHDASDTHTFSMLSNSVKVSITTSNGDGESSTVTLTSYQIQHLMWEGKLSISLNENTGEYTVSSTLFNALGSNQSMSVSFDYRASDGNGFDGTDGSNESSLSVAETATLVVNGTNDQPVAYEDTQSAWEQELSNIPSEDATFGGRLPGASDEDAISHITYAGVDANNNGQIDVTVVAPIGVDASQTVVTVNPNGTYSISNPTFDALAAGERATVTFSYVVDDGSGATDESSQSAPKSVTLTIFGTNDQPVVENVTIPGTEAATGVNTFTGSLSLHVNDVDVSDDHTFAIRTGSITSNNPLVSGLSVSLTSEGTYTIIGDFNKLALGESATIRFQYRADDGSGSPSWDESRYSDYKTVTLNVTGTNDAPVFTVEGEVYSFNYNENSAAGTLIGTVLAADIDHGSSVSYSITSGNDYGYFAIDPTTGAITLSEAGAHAFTNDFETLANIHSLVVGASDGIVTTSINVTLNEQNVNDAPDAIDDFGVSGMHAQFYGYNEGVDGTNLLSVAQIRAFMANNTPDATFTPTLLDYQYGTGNLASGTHLQTFLGVDAASLSTDPTDATDGIIHMSGYLNMDAGTYNFKVLSDDGYAILVDGQPVATFDNIQSPATHEHASFTIAASGLHQVEVIYWDQAGEYVFKAEISKNGGAYQVLDMSGGTSSLVTPEDTALTLTAATLLANDTDQDGDMLSIVSVQGATHGIVTLNGEGTVTFAPEANYNGVATFTYTMSDGHGGSDTATVTLNVTPVNDAPTFTAPYTFNYNENSVANAVLGTVQAADIDSASLTYSITSGNSNGYFAINSTTGVISLTAIGATSLANNYEALANTHNLTVSASDGIVSTSIAVTLNELDVNEVPPVNALNDSVITNAGSNTFLIPEWALLDNDVNANNITGIPSDTSLQAILMPTGVAVTDNSGGDGGSFTYTATDGVLSDIATVNVTRDTHGDLNGTSGNDILIAGNGKDVLVGGSGNDILLAGDNNDELSGGLGSDILKGESGNDTLIFDITDRSIDGGIGTDTLRFDSSGTINFNNIENGTIKNIEILDLTEANITITNLSLQDVIDMTEENSNTHMLTIEGGSTDTMNILTAPAGYSVVHTHSNSQDLDTYTYTSNSGDPTVVIKVDDTIHQS